VSSTPPGEVPPEQGPPEHRDRPAWARAVPLVVVAVVLGIVLLDVGSRAPVGTAASPTTTAPTSTTTTTTTHTGSSGKTTTTVPRSSVHVQVANGTQTGSIAGAYTAALQAQGWNTLPAENTSTVVTGSTVYYAAGQEQAAAEIATFLHLPPSSVMQITSAAPVASISGVDVLVVAGNDLAQRAPTSTSAT